MSPDSPVPPELRVNCKLLAGPKHNHKASESPRYYFLPCAFFSRGISRWIDKSGSARLKLLAGPKPNRKAREFRAHRDTIFFVALSSLQEFHGGSTKPEAIARARSPGGRRPPVPLPPEWLQPRYVPLRSSGERRPRCGNVVVDCRCQCAKRLFFICCGFVSDEDLSGQWMAIAACREPRTFSFIQPSTGSVYDRWDSAGRRCSRPSSTRPRIAAEHSAFRDLVPFVWLKTPPIGAKIETIIDEQTRAEFTRRYRTVQKRALTWLCKYIYSLVAGDVGMNRCWRVVQGAVVRIEQGRTVETIKVPLGLGQVCDDEMEGLLRATRRGQFRTGTRNVLCVADSQARHFIHDAALWPIPGHPLRPASPLDASPPPASNYHEHWTPAHIGTVGNELADEAAKAATEMEADPSLLVSLTTVRRLVHLQVLDKWRGLWDRSKAGEALGAIDKSPPSLKALYTFMSLPRKTISSISRLRTGPSHLNAHRHESGFVQSPACEACSEFYEMRARYLLQCPAHEHLRQPLHDAARRAGLFGSLRVSTFLCEPKTLKALGRLLRHPRGSRANNKPR